MKTLWIVSGGAEAVPGIQRAKNMGLHVVVSDANPNAPGFDFADEKIVASTYDAEATSSFAVRYHQEKRPIDGVISIAADVPLTVATVADRLGLPGISIETARISSDKLEMKKKFILSGIPAPWFVPIKSLKELETVLSERGYPLVIKPVDSRGARGVLKITDNINLAWAFKYSCQFSPSGMVMVEEFLEGPQISTESIIIDGIGVTIGFVDRNYEDVNKFLPHIIENGGQQPSILGDNEKKAVSKLAEQAGLALGVRNGVVKGDLVLTKDGPKVIEIAPRLSGGWLCTDQIPLGTGVDFVGAAIKLSLGENILPEELEPKYSKGVAIRYIFPETGRIKQIKNIDQFRSVPWIHRLDFFLKPGDVVESVANHTKRAGFVITTGKTREEAVERAMNVTSTVKIITEK